MGKCAIHDDGVEEEFVIYDVCLIDADRDVFCAELASADFGEVNLVKRNLALDVRGEDAVDVSADSDVGGEVTGEVLVVDGIVQVRLDAAEGKTVQVQENIEVVCCHVGVDLDAEVTAVCELEAHVDTGRVVFEVNGGDV